MKFVFNAERNERMRNILMMRPTVAEGEAMLAKDDTDAPCLVHLRYSPGPDGRL